MTQALGKNPEGLLVWALGVALCAVRFVGLEDSPPGFFSDEFRGALHQICLGQQQASASGEPWPLFVVGGGGGLYTPPFLYLGALWVEVFGPSIGSCRALAATFTLLATLATAGVARRLAGASVARWVFLAAALSPWAFQFARIAWDPPMAPAFLTASLFFWLGRGRLWETVLSSVCFVGALYTYPPMRIQAPLVWALLAFWVLRPRFSWRHLVVFAGVGLVLAAPLIAGTLDGSLNGRGGAESIFAPEFSAAHRGDQPRALFLLKALLQNLHAHFEPSYLFFEGDRNLRHSTSSFGVFGLLDAFALVVAVVWIALRLGRFAASPAAGAAARRRRPWDPTAPRVRLAVFAGAAYLLGVLPAALCWTGVPHALRSIGAWPFLAILTGIAVASLRERWGPIAAAAALSVAGAHAALFLPVYFERYPEISATWYDVSVKETLLAAKPRPAIFAKAVGDYPEAFRYYAIAYRGATCRSSDALLSEAKERIARRSRTGASR